LEYQFANGRQGDPVVLGLMEQTGKKFSFDLGSIESLAHRDVLKIRHCFVTHTHIDHFYGFDRLLRVNVPHGKEVEVCGPKGFIKNVQSKLNGYLWNLIEPGQVRFLVHEVDLSGDVKTASLRCESGFYPEEIPWQRYPCVAEKPVAAVTTFPDRSLVKAVVLDHGTPVCAYRVEGPPILKVNEAVLARLGYKPGPWLRDLQDAITRQDFHRIIKPTEDQPMMAEPLANQILEKKKSKSLCYMTDFLFSWENITRVYQLAQDCHNLICESSFADVDKKRAHRLKHLSTRQAALLAAWCSAEQLDTFHFSNIYGENPQWIYDEGQTFFQTFRENDRESLRILIDREIKESSEPA
jgi:ribonuclease Z